jgi:hypothetical protein
MSRIETRRAISTLVLSVLIVAASAVVIKANEMNEFCSNWNDSLTEPDDFWCSVDPYYWAWGGGYNISSMPPAEALSFAASLCDDLTYSCWDTCESSDYRWAMLAQVNQAAWPNCEYSVDCIMSWGNPSCQQSETTGSFGCTCQFMNVWGSC